MIVQACLNGSRDQAFHPALPTTPDTIVADAVAAVHAGAGELHVHIRDDTGRETLAPDAVDRTIMALRRACPGTLVGISTGEWIENDDARRRQYIGAWSVLPDYASVNIVERDCAAVVAALRERGIGVEAGLWTAADAKRCLALDLARPALRYLLEINHQAESEAFEELSALEAVLVRASVKAGSPAWARCDRVAVAGCCLCPWLFDPRRIRGRLRPAGRPRGAVERRAGQSCA